MKKIETQNTHPITFLLNSIGKKRLLHLLVIVFINSILDIVGIALIFPFLQIIANPSLLIDKANQLNIHIPFSHQNLVLSLGFLLISFYALKSLAQSKLAKKQAQYLSRYTGKNTNDIVSKILQARYSIFQNTAASEISGTAYSNTVHTSIALAALIQSFNEALIIVFLMIGFFWINPVLAVGTIGVLILISFLLFNFVIKKSSNLGVAQTHIENIRYRLLFSITTSIRDIKIMGLENLFDKKNQEISKQYADLAWRYNHNSALPRFIIEFLALSAVVAVAIITIISQIPGEDATPALGLLAVATVRAVPAFSRLFNSLSSYKFSSRFVQNLFALEQTLSSASAPYIKDNLSFSKSIQLKDICFSYHKNKIINNISLDIKFGESIAIVGPSGAGKSTLLDIFTGLQPATSGQFICDDEPFNPYTSESIHNLIGYVPQAITLLDETIAYNITFQSAPDLKKLNDVIRKACLEDLIKDIPEGLFTKVGENGLRLSGGQRQRIGIARALYKMPSILIFDEATSALDAVSERLLIDEIASLRGNVSSIMVTHKLSTAIFCDKIYVLNKGSVVAVGTHVELLKACKLYKQMFAIQQST
ncbi:ABC transporter ATP-binding protein [Methylophilus aquaticus]|uniref:ABC transporter ATP-binding protein n=1 Tax=Methylophilus aquaticus TaxID=1971610 RepID=A0ABT9JU53_9PROT|nr:ABC transporter ATP-binding protein [Methylophilus aquaticus]MDP8568087.1 ABC transporter ATP-binding protein [Methylophilus aquaticus]